MRLLLAPSRDLVDVETSPPHPSWRWQPVYSNSWPSGEDSGTRAARRSLRWPCPLPTARCALPASDQTHQPRHFGSWVLGPGHWPSKSLLLFGAQRLSLATSKPHHRYRLCLSRSLSPAACHRSASPTFAVNLSDCFALLHEFARSFWRVVDCRHGSTTLVYPPPPRVRLLLAHRVYSLPLPLPLPPTLNADNCPARLHLGRPLSSATPCSFASSCWSYSSSRAAVQRRKTPPCSTRRRFSRRAGLWLASGCPRIWNASFPRITFSSQMSPTVSRPSSRRTRPPWLCA